MFSLLCSRLLPASERGPNVLIMMADDLGFSDLGCYGSEIETPHLDEFASNGILFSNFHAAPTCSPTRAMLLTGVDHHRAGMGNMYEFLQSAPAQIGRAGYEGHLNSSVMTIAEVLRSAGYRSAISGKWHLAAHPVRANAPIGRGFDRSWILWSGWAEHHQPPRSRLFIDGERRVSYPTGRYSTEWYTEKAIEFADAAIDEQAPFFLFVSYTAPHWPLEAPAAMIQAQAGKYDDGYDRLRQRRIAGLVEKGILSKDVPIAETPAQRPLLHHREANEQTRRWDQLDSMERIYSARLMEVYAAMVQTLDQQAGRLLTHLKRRDQLDNTLVIFLSDNGAAPMSSSPSNPRNALPNVGHPNSFVGYGPEWARASGGPLRLMKGHATEGGTRVPAVIQLPKRQRPEPRVSHQFASVLDIAPTIYQLAGATYPKLHKQVALAELSGVSMLPYLIGQRDQIHGKDDAMGWELFGRTAFRRGKWKVTWVEKPFGSSTFELFDIERDPGEAQDLRRQHPEIYQQMLDGFRAYAQQNGVIIARPPHWQ